MGLVSAFGVAQIISDGLLCRPLSTVGDPLETGDCADTWQPQIAFSRCNIAIDSIILLLPIPMVWRLQMATRRKIELTIIFALGFMYVPPYTSPRKVELFSTNTVFAPSLSSASS